MSQCEQQKLELFSSTFECILKGKCKENLLEIKRNSRMINGWNVTINKFSGKRILSIPVAFDLAPEDVKNALIHWALLPFPRSHKEKNLIALQRKNIERFIRQYLHQSGNLKQSTTRIDRCSLELKTSGIKFDLKDIFNKINETYFNNAIHSYVRWGSKGSMTSYQTIKTSPDGTRWNLITIAGIYNHQLVPQYALESVMYHEMLHIAIPPCRNNGRNVIHGKEFKEAERKFPFFDAWRQWEKTEVRNLCKEFRKKWA